MALAGEVSKALIILAPNHTEEARISQLRNNLIDEGFVVVREESRLLNSEAVAKLTAGEVCAISTASLMGNAYLIVVARNNAAEELSKFLVKYKVENVFATTKAGSAGRKLQMLFPRMSVEPLPTNAEAHEFVNENLKTVLVQGLTEVAKRKPENSLKWLAEYLLEHNPNRPPINKTEK